MLGTGLGVTLWLGVAAVGMRPAYAGDTATSSISPEITAPRFYAGSDAGAPAHTNDFSPESINFTDCTSDIDIAFTLDLSGIFPDDEIQAWAGTGTADCTQVSARSSGSNATPNNFPGLCWPVAAPGAFDASKATSTARLHVRDLVAHIGDTTATTTYTRTTSTSVCQPKGTNTAVQLNIFFIAVPSGNDGTGDGGAAGTVSAPDGISGLYSTPAALVGPFAPLSVSVPNSGITPTSLMVSWSPQGETVNGASVIQGYNIYRQDQGVNGTNTGFTSDAHATLENRVECRVPNACTIDAGHDAGHDAGIPGDAQAGDASDAHVADATLADAQPVDAHTVPVSTTCDGGLSDASALVDAAAYTGLSAAQLAALGCEILPPLNGFQTEASTGGQVCVSGVLDSVFTVDGGVGTTAIATSLDAGIVSTVGTVGEDAGEDASEDGATSTSFDAGQIVTTTSTNQETAGISAIPAGYLGFYASGATASSYIVTGLTTGHQYAIGVAAVDAYGNVGPISNLGCSTPTDINDFYAVYTADGGTAGGGYCTLSAVGAPAFGSVFGIGLAGAGFLLARRRSRSRARADVRRSEKRTP